MRSALSKRLRGSISVRIAVLFSATFAIALLLAFVVTYVNIDNSLQNSSREVIASKFSEASAVLSVSGLAGLGSFLSNEANRELDAPYLVRVISKSGETLLMKPSVQKKNFNFEAAFQQYKDPSNNLGWSALSAINDEDKFDILTNKVGDNYLQIGKSSEDREDVLERIVDSFTFIGAVFIVLGTGLGVLYARRALAPVRDLVTTIRRIETGDLSGRVPVDASRGEMRDLGDTFNRMIGTIENLVIMMRESLDNVAHDIRTPLTRIRAVAEDALVSKSPAPLVTALEDCAESATDISSLVDQLLSISEAEARTLILNTEQADIQKLIDEVVEIYDFVAQERKIGITKLEIGPGLTWNLDRKRVKQVLGNLLDNAVKFSPEGSTVIVTAERSARGLEISVADQGPGIPDGDLPRIWDRLFRGDRNRSTKGSGLGLAIVKAVVTAHGGAVEAVRQAPSGMKFTFWIAEL